MSEPRVVLERIAADPALAFALDALLPASAGQRLGQALRTELEVLGVQVIRHKSGRRALLEYQLATPRGPLTVIGKVRARGLDSATHQLQEALWAGGFDDASPDGLCVPEPLGVVPDWHMTLQRRVAGRPIDLTASPAELSRAADLLDRLGGFPYLLARRHSAQDELDILQGQLGALAASRPRWRRRISDILAGCAALIPSLHGRPTRLIHRDCYGEQFLSGQRLYLLDLDLCCQGDPALDVGNFLAHLRELSLRATGQAGASLALERALQARFLAHAGPEGLRAAHSYALLSLARHIAISQRLPERRHVTPLLIEHCESQLGLFALTRRWAC